MILVKHGTRLATRDNITAMSDALGRQGFGRSLVAIVDDFSDLTVLDEEQMRAVGWMRIPPTPEEPTQEEQPDATYPTRTE